MAPEVGLVLITLGIESIGLGVELPIDMFGALSRIVDFVFCKLCGKAVEGTLVDATDKALHDLLGQKLQVLEELGLM